MQEFTEFNAKTSDKFGKMWSNDNLSLNKSLRYLPQVHKSHAISRLTTINYATKLFNSFIDQPILQFISEF